MIEAAVQLRDSHRLLLGYLHRHAVGRASARSYPEILRALTPIAERMRLPHVTPRGIYRLVADLQAAGAPVGSTTGDPPGAFVCADRFDWRLGYRNLYTRLRTQARRCRRFRRTFTEVARGQRTFDWTDADRFLASAVLDRLTAASPRP